MEVVFVVPDYYARFPPACMDGWGRRFMVVSPDGLLLPCLLAHTLPGLSFGNVRERSVEELWSSSPGMVAFRGESWMPEPCRSCERRSIDFGGCRCQAFHLTGNAAATDPACSLSPEHARGDALPGERRSAHQPAVVRPDEDSGSEPAQGERQLRLDQRRARIDMGEPEEARRQQRHPKRGGCTRADAVGSDAGERCAD